jgi:hypothetical protein
MRTVIKDAGKSASKGNDSKKIIKYSDKSAGQPELLPIFDKIKNMLKYYEKNNFKPRNEKPGSYSLYCIAPIIVDGRKFEEICFASLLIQKGYVGFYFFPIYVDPSLVKLLNDWLLKCLKGKTCFHIKKDDEKLMNEIKVALQIGYQFYSKQGWA